jgi:hypothetical protein
MSFFSSSFFVSLCTMSYDDLYGAYGIYTDLMKEDNVLEFRILMKRYPLSPKFEQNVGETAFCRACLHGATKIVMLLLQQIPELDIDERREAYPSSALIHAMIYHPLPQLLLMDPRCQPLLRSGGKNNIIHRLLGVTTNVSAFKYLFASDVTANSEALIEPDLQTKLEKELTTRRYTPSERKLVADMIRDFFDNPLELRNRLRLDPEVRGAFIAHLFALVVFFSDGYVAAPKTPLVSQRLSSGRILRVARPLPAKTVKIVRFLKMCTRLPIEIQMIICHCAFNSPKNVVHSTDTEYGLLWLSRSCQEWK